MNENTTSELNPTTGWIEITYDDNKCMGSYSSNQQTVTLDSYVGIVKDIMTSCAQKDNCKLTIHDNGVYSKTLGDRTESYWYAKKS
jgi:hypothetical protein